ncbi:HCP-like protein [Linderina pennispora]|uniref:HCP-like protein n=1 Tax=Linderina pennispora TaxID=61395 RepID=A0A1Y1WJF0_9FUNG|nr:HCP-like protein [Linderina pennispora]ORX73700.1 HCP-like protein [Linderina pennispora]
MSRSKPKADANQAASPQRYLDAGIEAARMDHGRQHQAQQYDDGMSMYSPTIALHGSPRPSTSSHHNSTICRHSLASSSSSPSQHRQCRRQASTTRPWLFHNVATWMTPMTTLTMLPATIRHRRSRGCLAQPHHLAISTWPSTITAPMATCLREAFLRSAGKNQEQDPQCRSSLDHCRAAASRRKRSWPTSTFQRQVNFHEEGDFVSATAYFKKAADAHSPLGMLFYGLSLRHGWGCQPNEKIAFLYLQKAGELVIPSVKDMNPAVAGMAKEELAMAIYELGQSYRQGWGVSRNKKTAAYYFEIAAELGDADAQADLAACYESGDGVKRDKKKAAHYYRLAHKQGHEVFGNSWIFKKKYDSD